MRDLYERKSLFDTQNFLPVKTSAEGQAILTKLFFVKNQKELDEKSHKKFFLVIGKHPSEKNNNPENIHHEKSRLRNKPAGKKQLRKKSTPKNIPL